MNIKLFHAIQEHVRQLLNRLIAIPEFSSIVGLIIVMLIFSGLSNKFLAVENLVGIFTVASELGIVSVGVCFLMISGEFDLSVGSVYAISAMVAALLIKSGFPGLIVFLAGICVAAAIGLLNGFIVTRTRIASFIVTLGGLMFYRGILLAVSGGFQIFYGGKDKFILNALGGRLITTGLRSSGLWLIASVIAFSVLLHNTQYGNHVFAVGGNAEAAKAVGVNVARVKMISFMVCSVMSGLAGLTMFGRFHAIDPAAGTALELESIAACVIGGVLLTGGFGSILGAFLGALLIGVTRSGLILAGAPSYWYQGFIGLILVISVIMNSGIRRRVVGE